MHDAIEVAVEGARSHGLVVMAGAGVSAGAPASLPAWKPLNAAIARALATRLEALRRRPGWLAEVSAAVDAHRNANRFPPEYQAQLIHEMCGERYFRSLQSLDIDTTNAAHDAIAALAASGRVRAILTTNFDRLIERALERRHVPYVGVFDEAGFARLAEGGAAQGKALPVIKIHGCVSDHLSMIDTLKQRRLGRSAKLEACLDALHTHYWIYAGFSAADLEGDQDYLGLRRGAARAPGALYVSWPGLPPVARPALSKGATVLKDAYGPGWRDIGAEVGDAVGAIAARLGVAPGEAPTPGAGGAKLVEAGLARWAGELSPAATALCFGAVLEAVGEAEAGVRVIDRFVRHELVGDDRQGGDYQALQLHYGRMGAALGRFISVPDVNGAASNASVETVQSLLRLKGSELEFGALALLATTWLWLGEGARALTGARDVLRAAALHGAWEPRLAHDDANPAPKPRTPEDAVDGWLAAAQVAAVAGEQALSEFIAGTAEEVAAVARRAGDPVRAARAASLYLLVMSETSIDLPALSTTFSSDFAEAQRVGDGLACGFRALALGRWLVGSGGLALAASSPGAAADVAGRALGELGTADTLFERQGMDPWVVYSLVQQAKALADLHRFDDAQEKVTRAAQALDRFPIWTSHLHEAVGQLHAMHGREQEAGQSFVRAIESASAHGLLGRAARLQRAL